MPTERDIYRSAGVLVRQYGRDAPLEAARFADAMLAKGDIEGQQAWKRIMRAAHELLRAQPEEGERRH